MPKPISPIVSHLCRFLQSHWKLHLLLLCSPSSHSLLPLSLILSELPGFFLSIETEIQQLSLNGRDKRQSCSEFTLRCLPNAGPVFKFESHYSHYGHFHFPPQLIKDFPSLPQYAKGQYHRIVMVRHSIGHTINIFECYPKDLRIYLVSNGELSDDIKCAF